MSTNTTDKIMITGSSGYVGSNLLDYLIDNGFNVIGASRSRLKSNNTETRKFSLDELSLTKLDDINTVIHTAGLVHSINENGSDFDLYNNRATIEFAELCARKGVRNFIFISTIGVHGQSSNLVIDEMSPIKIHNAYSKSKHDAECQLINLSKEIACMNIVILRPPMIYGPSAPGNYKKLEKFMRKGLPLPFANLSNKRSFCHIENFCSFIERLIKIPDLSKFNREIFIVSDNEQVTTPAFIKYVAEVNKTKAWLVPVYKNVLIAFFLLIRRKFLVDSIMGNLIVCNSKARNMLDWNPKKFIRHQTL